MFKKIIPLMVFLLLACPVSAFRPITGFVPSGYDEKSISLDLVVSENQNAVVSIDLPESAELISVKLSGKVIGSGRASAFLNHDKELLRIFDYNEKKSSIIGLITGFFTGVENALTGTAALDLDSNITGEITFESECIDTCYLNLGNKREIDIDFVIEPGTTVELSSIEYQYVPVSAPEQTPFRLFLSKILNILE